MQAQRNVANLIVVNATAATAGMETNNVDGYISSMNTGEPVVISPGGIVVDATGTLPTEFKIATKLTDGSLNYSDIIRAKSIKSIHANKYTAATNQLDYIGYNGSSGSIDVINDNIYSVKLYLRPTDTAGFMQQKIKEGFYETDSTATQSEIAKGLTESLIKNFSREPDKVKFGTDRFTFERINAGAQKNAMASATATVTRGSNTILLSEDESLTCLVGDVIRLGGTGAGTAPCYVVTAVSASGLIVTLDLPWQGTSQTIAHGNVETVTEGNWGIKLSSVTYYYEEPKFRYSQPIWDTILQDCGATLVTKSTATSPGTGDYRQIHAMEQLFLGNEGNYYRAQIPQPTFRTEVSSSKTYAIVTIEYEGEMTTELGGQANSLKQLILACEKGDVGAYKDANTGLGTILNAYVTAYSIPLTYTTSATIATEINA